MLEDDFVTKLMAKTRMIFSLKGVNHANTETRDLVANTFEVMQQFVQTLSEAVGRIDYFLRSMMKFSFLSQRVFIHLIYQGFCG